MALRQLRIGSLPDVFQYDDGDFDSAIDTDHFIKTSQAPVAASDVVRLGDLPSGTAEILHSDNVIADDKAVDGISGRSPHCPGCGPDRNILGKYNRQKRGPHPG